MIQDNKVRTFSQALVTGLPFAPWEYTHTPTAPALRIVPSVPVYPHLPLQYVLLREI